MLWSFHILSQYTQHCHFLKVGGQVRSNLGRGYPPKTSIYKSISLNPKSWSACSLVLSKLFICVMLVYHHVMPCLRAAPPHVYCSSKTRHQPSSLFNIPHSSLITASWEPSPWNWTYFLTEWAFAYFAKILSNLTLSNKTCSCQKFEL